MIQRLIHSLMRIVVAVIVCGGALTLIYMSMVTDSEWQETVTKVSTFQVEILMFGFAAFTVGVVYMMSGNEPARPDKILTFPGGSGAMSVGLRELAEFLSPIADDIDAVETLRPRVEVEKHGIHVILDVTIAEGPHVRDACDALQQQARRRLAVGLGIRDISNVTVHVAGFCRKGESNWGSDEAAAAGPAEAAPAAAEVVEADAVAEPDNTGDEKHV